MTRRLQSINRVRRQRRREMRGFIVTWDVDSSDPALCSRLRRFVFGCDVRNDSRSYHYPGIVESEGALYIGQSVLFVTAPLLPVLRDFLTANGIDHVVMEARINRVLPN